MRCAKARSGEIHARSPRYGLVVPTELSRRLAALYGCVLVVMIGFGITLPVMPLYVERLALGADATPARASFHTGLITAAYPLTQLLLAPLWGKLSDRIGRRPLVLIGIAGFAVTQVLFGVARGLPLLYMARVLGGALAAALVPAATAAVSDLTRDDDRARGIAHLNTAIGLGTVIGPAFGAILARRDLHLRFASDHVAFDSFSVPFVAAALLAMIALLAAAFTLRETRPTAASTAIEAARDPQRVHRLLAAAMASYIGISIFEATFALFAVARYDFGPGAIAAAFMECSMVMIAAQLATPRLARRFGERRLLPLGFAAMSAGLVGLVIVRVPALAYLAVFPLGAGMAFVGPMLTSEVTRHRAHHVGAALGLQQAAQSLGQVAGAVLGTLLFGWNAPAPYLVAASILAGTGVLMLVRR